MSKNMFFSITLGFGEISRITSALRSQMGIQPKYNADLCKKFESLDKKALIVQVAEDLGHTEPEFLTQLAEDTTGTVDRIYSLIINGQAEHARQEIEKLYDEFTYFNAFDDDMIVYMTNEAYVP